MTASFVYFIAAGEDRIKIGWSTDPERRLKELQTASGRRLTLLAKIQGGLREERALHEMFVTHRLEGEWFTFHEEIWVEIDRLLAGGVVAVPQRDLCGRSPRTNPLVTEINDRMVAYFKSIYPTLTGKHVAEATGLQRAAVEKMLATRSGMSATSMHACLQAFGPAFLAACVPDRLRPKWIDDAVAWEKRHQLDQAIAELAALRQSA